MTCIKGYVTFFCWMFCFFEKIRVMWGDGHMKSYLADFSVLTSKLSSIGFFATLYEDLIPDFPTNLFPGWRGILARRRVATLRLDQVCQAVEPKLVTNV